jgi:hypothetical protein
MFRVLLIAALLWIPITGSPDEPTPVGPTVTAEAIVADSAAGTAAAEGLAAKAPEPPAPMWPWLAGGGLAMAIAFGRRALRLAEMIPGVPGLLAGLANMGWDTLATKEQRAAEARGEVALREAVAFGKAAFTLLQAKDPDRAAALLRAAKEVQRRLGVREDLRPVIAAVDAGDSPLMGIAQGVAVLSPG